jgi:hypothetical protein
MNFFETVFLLIAAHFLCDYPLQGDWLSKIKNHKIDMVGEMIWPEALIGHSMIHAAAVYLITGNQCVAVSELVIHAATDFSKCEGWIGYRTDQSIHLACKILWALLLWLTTF